MSDCIPLIAAPPDGSWIAIACGHDVHVFKCAVSNGKPAVLSSKEKVLTLCASYDQRWLLSSGDDKEVNIWSTNLWTCEHQSKAAKKVSSGCFTPDSRYAIVGDKFGDVYIMASHGKDTELRPLLGHYCAILSTISVAANGRLLASGDRDGKLRVSILPDDPLKGSWEIETFCLLHTAAITCSAFCRTGEGPEEILISGALDGQLIAWDYTTGEDLCIMQASKRTANDSSEQGTAGVVALAAQGQLVALAVEGEAEVAIVRSCRNESGAVQLQEVCRVAVDGILLPCNLRFTSAQELWVVGCAAADGQGTVRAGCLHQAGDGSWQSCRDSELAARICEHVEKIACGKLAQYNPMLRKREYLPEEKAERQGKHRKRQRKGTDDAGPADGTGGTDGAQVVDEADH